MQLLAGCITVILSLLWCNAINAEEVFFNKVDSIYQSLSPEEKVNHLIWLQIDNSEQLQNLPKGHTLYMTRQSGISKNNIETYNVAFQLDHSMNPDFSERLPSLEMLSSINSETLLNQYFEYLKELGGSLGFNYLVLPTSQNPRASRLLSKMNQYAPTYFLKHEDLFFGLRKKKEVKEAFVTKNFWIIRPESLEESRITVKKISNKLPVARKERNLKQSIQNLLDQEIESSPPLFSRNLELKLKQASVALLEIERMLPLTTDTVCFITNDPYGDMANMLRNYAYLITSLEDIKNSSAPIVADYSPLILPDFSGRTMIYIGDLEHFDETLFNGALIVSLADKDFDFILPQQLFGTCGVSGSIIDRFHLVETFMNNTISDRHKLGFAPPESAGVSDVDLDAITQIIDEGILKRAFPGCQLTIAYQGSIIHHKNYGYLTYDNLIPVDATTVYDLASVTKVVGTLQALMQLYDQQKIDLDKTISQYLPEYSESNKYNITLKALLSHQAGLLPYVPFWKRALNRDYLEPFYASPLENQMSPWALGIKPHLTMKDTMSNWILHSPLLQYDSIPYYSYSDIGFMILQEVVEKVTHQSLEEYLNEHFYQPLCLERIGFNPRKWGIDLYEIAPTEYDQHYRSEQIWGEVHDRNAAMLNGVGGHAGLFSNAKDLAVLMQMTLQGGNYDENYYYDAQTVDLFNNRYFPNNRRGLGWDKKDDMIGNVSKFASDKSFGHTGFTGTMVWIDPEYDLVFVFLTNRIHPDSNNRKLNELEIRTRIQDVVYKAIQAKNTK